MTVTVCSTDTPTWPGQGPRTVLVVGGRLDTAAMVGLMTEVRRAVRSGVCRVLLDVGAVVRFDRAALLALADVRGPVPDRPGCVVDVVGVRPDQVTAVLAAQRPEDPVDVREVVRRLRRPVVVAENWTRSTADEPAAERALG